MGVKLIFQLGRGTSDRRRGDSDSSESEGGIGQKGDFRGDVGCRWCLRAASEGLRGQRWLSGGEAKCV